MSTLNSQDGRVRHTVSTLGSLNNEGLLSDGIVCDLLGCLLPRSANHPFSLCSSNDELEYILSCKTKLEADVALSSLTLLTTV
jgi:hypothetical protein